ncbi:MAG: endonuclease/exonuclease/phosphatase family protein, partial [Desulfoferrobacter sp.]
MRIMTFNLRFENDRDGQNSWSNRKNLVIEVIQKYAPSILGTQEGTQRQLAYLHDCLSGYEMSAPERSFDETCQYPTLFYRKDKLRVISCGEFWLSKTPHIHRSKNWDSAFPRMMSYSLFEDLDFHKTFWAIVTHLDHIGMEARRQQAKIIAEWIERKSEPVVLMGDFN